MSTKEVELKVAESTVTLLAKQWQIVAAKPNSLKRSNQLATLDAWLNQAISRLAELKQHKAS